LAEKDWTRLSIGEVKVSIKRSTTHRMVRQYTILKKLGHINSWDDYFNWLTMQGLNKTLDNVALDLTDLLLGLSDNSTIPITRKR